MEEGSVSLPTSGSREFLGAAEPGKLRVQRRDGLGRRLGPGMADNSGVWLLLGVRLQARTPVAGLSFATARADAPPLLGRLIKGEEVGEGGHGLSLGMTIHAVEGTEKQAQGDPFVSPLFFAFSKTYGSERATRWRVRRRAGCRVSKRHSRLADASASSSAALRRPAVSI
jgi:hypothetical protein